jgi:hypothetical protein
VANKKYWETPEFKELDKDWNKKLKDSGFNDLESEFDRKNRTVSKQQVTVDHDRIRYFARCVEYLYKNKWKSPTDRFIFERHCVGDSNYQIAKQLKAKKLRAIHPSNVDRRLLNILKEANIEPHTFKF